MTESNITPIVVLLQQIRSNTVNAKAVVEAVAAALDAVRRGIVVGL